MDGSFSKEIVRRYLAASTEAVYLFSRSSFYLLHFFFPFLSFSSTLVCCPVSSRSDCTTCSENPFDFVVASGSPRGRTPPSISPLVHLLLLVSSSFSLAAPAAPTQEGRGGGDWSMFLYPFLNAPVTESQMLVLAGARRVDPRIILWAQLVTYLWLAERKALHGGHAGCGL